MEQSGRRRLNQASTLNVARNGADQFTCLFMSLPKPKVRDTPQNNWLGHHVKVTEDEKRLRRCPRFKETDETCLLQ